MTDDIERLLRDERELRAGLERRLAAEVDKAATWRQRAEERAERIERLTADATRRRSPLAALRNLVRVDRGRSSLPSSPAEPAAAYRAQRAPRLANLTVAGALGDPGHRPVCFDVRWKELSADGPEGADLVLVDTAGWEALTPDRRAQLEEYLSAPGAPPVATWDEDTRRVPVPLRDAAAAIVGLPPVAEPPDGRPGLGEDPPDEASDQIDVIRAAMRGCPPAAAGGTSGDRDRASVAVRRWAVRTHAPWARMSEILVTAGVDHRSPWPSVGAVLVTNRPDRVQAAVRSIRRQSYPDVDLVVVLHGIDVPSSQLDGAPTVVHAPESWTLGRCLNAGVERTGASVIAKIDDDDHYGSHYVEDSVHTLVTSDAGVVGKAAMYVYLGDEDRTVIRRAADEERYVSGTMPGGSLVFHRRVWDEAAFPHRPRFVDAVFLDAARANGERTRAGHRFEFCLVRHGEGHTYQASTDIFLAGAATAWEGHHPERVDVADLEATA